MFNIIMVLLTSLIGLICLLFNVTEMHIIGYVTFGFSFLWFISSFISNLVHYDDQLQRFESLRGYLKQTKVYDKIQQGLIIDLKLYLGEKYPDIEKELFTKISESNVNTILAYPEIKSSDTIKELLSGINKIKHSIYQQQQDMINKGSDILYHNASKWEIIKPSIPEDIKTIINSDYKE
jgi:hypothetical protein